MHLFQILLPRADNTGRPFDRDDFDRVKEELASLFNGSQLIFRALRKVCGERGPSSDADQIVIFEVISDEVDLPDWRNRRTELERRFSAGEAADYSGDMPMALV